MSEGSITYQGQGEPCGITTVINSQLKNHMVCSDGLACIQTDIGESATGKLCQSVEVLVGERCVPEYDMCFGGIDCLLNLDGLYTCGGEEEWGGNEDYVETGYIQSSEFQLNFLLIILGVIILVFYLLLLCYELFVKTIYPNKDNIKKVNANAGNIF